VIRQRNCHHAAPAACFRPGVSPIFVHLLHVWTMENCLVFSSIADRLALPCHRDYIFHKPK
jgi:hypothetical protein